MSVPPSFAGAPPEPFGLYPNLLRPLFFRFDSEWIHDRLMTGMRLAGHVGLCPLINSLSSFDDQRLAVRLFGRVLSSPVGLAAGFDKNARALPFLQSLGFSHLEIGTVTPRPQPGNERPRIFRSPPDGALINRMGFPSAGMEAVEPELKRWKQNPQRALVGVNLGKNKDTPLEDAALDYRAAFERLGAYADYVAINVSSPNTPQLRELQKREALSRLIATVQEVNATKIPILVKVAPDLTWPELDDVLDACSEQGVSAVIATNTTFSREGVTTDLNEQGGLSGAPLFDRACEVVHYIYQRMGESLPVIGVGGVSSASHVLHMMSCGAVAVQLYTGFVYQGPGVVRKVKKSLLRFVEKEGLSSLREIIGAQETLQIPR